MTDENCKIISTDNGEHSHLLNVENNTNARIQAPEQQTLLANTMANTRENQSRTLPQYISALSATGGAFAAGTLLGWTSPAQNRLINGEYGFPISSVEFSWIGSAVTLGAACVCIPTGFLINIIGRKLTMLLLVLPFTLGWSLLIWAQNVNMMYAARFILGISGGAFCVVAPMYTGEIAHKEIRGTLGSFFQLMITSGILFVYIIGSSLNVYCMSIICGIIPIIFGIIFVFMPETPTYLISKGKSETAIKSVQWLRGKNYDYKPEIDELKLMEQEIRENSTTVGGALLRRVTLKALAISFGLMFFQQVSGINAVIFYSTDIFKDAQTGINESVSTIIVGFMQVIATFISVLVVDKLGRRLLLLTSAFIMSLSTIAMGIYFYMKDNDAESVKTLAWLPVTALCLFIITFSLGFGPVPWLMMGELFASDIKGVAGSLAGTSNWILAFIITKTFVTLKECLGNGQTFWLFAGLTIIGAIFVFIFVPETKGKTLNEIQQILGNGNDSTTVNSNNVPNSTMNSNVSDTENNNSNYI